MPQNNSHKNKEGYSDPTVYEALRKIDEEDARFHRLLDMIFYLPTFCPLLKLLFGHEKPSVFKGLRAQSPFCPLFSLHYYDKKIKNI